MSGVVRSIANASWAMTLFGAQQIRNVILADTDRAASAVDNLTETIRDEFGEDWDRVFRAVDQLQSKAVDRFVPGSRQSIELGLALLSRSARTLAEVPGLRSNALELTNKVQAFSTFQKAEQLLGGIDHGSLPTRIEQATRLSPYDRLWALEGIGFSHAPGTGRGPAVKDVLHELDDPAPALIPLHTGAGLSLAMRALEAIDPWGKCDSLGTALEKFRSDCRASAAPGCELMMFEAIGLVIRTLYPHLLQRVDRALEAIDPELVACYWHGVGRALYFAPTHALPGVITWRQMLAKAGQESDHTIGRQNALAGLSWAVTLVNFRHPEILASLVLGHRGAIFDLPAFANGVSSAALLWAVANGRESHLENLFRHRPRASLNESWQQMVIRPVTSTLSQRPRDESLGSMFRFLPSESNHSSDSDPVDTCRSPTLLVLSQVLDGWFSRAMSP